MSETDQLTDEVLDLALEPLRVLYPQAHILPVGTSNWLSRLGLQRCVEAVHTGGVVDQWLTLRNPSTAQGHWYLQQLLFLPQAAPAHGRQDPYDMHPEHLGAQSFPQPPLPAVPHKQGQEALLQGPLLNTTTVVQQRRCRDADRAEPDRTNCKVAAWTVACRHLARHTRGLSPYKPADRTVLASTVAAVTMRPVASCTAQLLPPVPCQSARPPPRPAAKHAPMPPLTVEQLYAVAAALLADCGERFVHHHGPTQITGSIQGPQCDAPHLWRAALHERTRIRDADGGTPPLRALAGRSAGDARGGLPGCPAWSRRRLPLACLSRRQVDHLAWHHQTTGLPRPRRFVAGAHPGLLHGCGPLAAGSPAAHHHHPEHTAGAGMDQPPQTGLELRPGGTPAGRMARRRHLDPVRSRTYTQGPSSMPARQLPLQWRTIDSRSGSA